MESSRDLIADDGRALPPIPDYAGAGICNVVPAAFLHLARSRGSLFAKSLDEIEESVHNINRGITPDLESWYPEHVRDASQVVLLVLDGLGYNQLLRFSMEMSNLASLSRSKISSVAPTTTATALTSITTGATPATHGILGYRMRMSHDNIINTLSWSCQTDGREALPDPKDLQQTQPFLNFHPKVVTKAQYQGSGFTKAHLRDTQIVDYRFPSTLVEHVAELVHKDEAFVYSYYEGIDTVAHEYGLGDCYVEELRAVDYLVGRLLSVLPKGAALLITADHGQVEVPRAPIELDPAILDSVTMLSGEGRFRWLHLREGSEMKVLGIAHELYDSVAWVVGRRELVERGYYGSTDTGLCDGARLGDIALIAKSNIAFYDPVDTGPYNLICRHGSLTSDELDVPLLSFLG